MTALDAASAEVDVVTSKKKPPVTDGASAVKYTWTLSPAGMVQELASSMVIPWAMSEPAPPVPAVPFCRHEPPTI